MADMYNWDQVLKEDKSRRNTKNPSFSSSLLDEIYRSIDGSDEKFGEFKRKPKVAKKQSGGGGGGDGGGRGRYKSSSAVEDEEVASFRRACLVDKWMEMRGQEKVSTRRSTRPASLPEFDRKMLLDNDPMFFSSGSSSSDSSFGWSTEAEVVKPKPSCFGPFHKVKTSVSPRSVANKQQNEFYLFDENQTNKTDSGLIRSKTRALKIYTSLKKVKQPISPGGRLTNFLNALFPNGHSKKSKDSGFEGRNQTRAERKTKSTNVSTCSSASSFSRSCLSKNSPRSREQLNNGMRRTVRFYPVSVIVDQDSRPCGQKNVSNKQDFEKFQWQKTEKSNVRQIPTRENDNDDEEDEEDDMASDTSSDLFELDHLNIFKNEQYCEELPVYETTHLSTNRAIASGLIC